MTSRRLTRSLAIGTGLVTSCALAIALAPAATAAEPGDASARPDDRPYVGARLVASRDGATVAHVDEDGPVDDAGIAEGDIVVSIDGVALDERGALREALADVAAGDELRIVYTHDGGEHTATVTVGSPEDRPAPPDAADVPWVGARLVRAEAGDGVLVRGVLADSPADAAGLIAGDVVTEINGESVSEWWQAREMLRDLAPGDTVELTVVRDGDERELDLTLGSLADAPARPERGESQGAGEGPHGNGPGRDGERGEGDGSRGDGQGGRGPRG